MCNLQYTHYLKNSRILKKYKKIKKHRVIIDLECVSIGDHRRDFPIDSLSLFAIREGRIAGCYLRRGNY